MNLISKTGSESIWTSIYRLQREWQRKFQCCSSALRNEPDVPVGTFSKRADGKRREAWGGCSLLHYAAERYSQKGIGEKLTPLPPMPKCQILIAKPPISVSTKMVYEKLDSCEIKEHPDIDGILDGLKNQDLEQVAASLGNVLEKVTVEAYPVIAQIKECMMEAGALGAMMSGSGPTVFGIFRDRRTAKEAFTKVKAQNLAKQIYLANVHNVRRR